MYQPAHGKFAVADPAALLAELTRHVPATLVTVGANGLRASILPMLYDPGDGDHGTLRGHLARPNPQWRDAGGDLEALAILDGPDAYVSPALYEEKRLTGKVVPTWNYVTAHVYGRLVVHDDPAWVEALVRRLTAKHEGGRAHPWSMDDAPPPFLAGQLRAIVGVELRITRIDAKAKLSQNRPEADVAGVVAGLTADARLEAAAAVEHARHS